MEKLFSRGIVGIMRNGLDAVPNELADLRVYLASVQAMLAEKASEHAPFWSLSESAAAETETLLDLESAIARKAVRTRAASLRHVLEKFEIWELIAPDDTEAEHDALDRMLVRSALEDLRRIDGVRAGRA
jgi:hypothetical protein